MGKIILIVVGFILGVAAGAGGISFMRTKGMDLAVKVFPTLAVTPSPMEGDGATKKPVPGSSAKEVEVRQMIAELKQTKEQLDKREKLVSALEVQTRQEREQLDLTKKKIDGALAQVNADATQRDETDMKNSKRLAKLWAQMDPAEVYKIIKDLDETLTARVMYAMSERQAAPILGYCALTGTDGAHLAGAITKRLKIMRITSALPPDATAETANQ